MDGSSKQPEARVVGQVEMRPLALVRPNDWNPNRVPEHVMESIRHGFRTDGWLASMALTIWATDENGEVQNVIIDGEHRWIAGNDVGLVEGPMVFLHGLSRAQAAKLTIALDKKRGSFDEKALSEIVVEIIEAGVGENLSIDLGFTDAEMAGLVAYAQGVLPPTPVEEKASEELDPQEFADFEEGKSGDDDYVAFRCGTYAGKISKPLAARFGELFEQHKGELGEGGKLLDNVLRRWLGLEAS